MPVRGRVVSLRGGCAFAHAQFGAWSGAWSGAASSWLVAQFPAPLGVWVIAVLDVAL